MKVSGVLKAVEGMAVEGRGMAVELKEEVDLMSV